MKRYALLKLRFNANLVISETMAMNLQEAIQKFNRCTVGVQLNADGYAKLNEEISFTVAEFWDSYQQW